MINRHVMFCLASDFLNLGDDDVRNGRKLGFPLLAIWLILTGLLTFVSIPIPQMGMILAILAIASGVLILLER